MWWQLLYNAVLQFLQAEKTIRLRSLVSMGYDMKEITQIYHEANLQKLDAQKQEIKIFVGELDDFRLSDESSLSDADKSLLYDIAA